MDQVPNNAKGADEADTAGDIALKPPSEATSLTGYNPHDSLQKVVDTFNHRRYFQSQNLQAFSYTKRFI